MTRDEIEKLSDEELNALLATEVMGQTDFSHPGFFWEEGTTEDGQDGWDGWYCPRCHADRGDTGKCVKKYASDIAAAMQVEERIQELEMVVAYCTYLTVICDAKYNKQLEAWKRSEQPLIPLSWFLIHASPRDRCRAALLAKMQP